MRTIFTASFLLFIFFQQGFAQISDTIFRSNVNDILEKFEKVEEEKVISVSQTEELLSDVPAVTTVITAEQIKSLNFNDLSDLLRILPGVDMTDNARAYGEYYTIRGINGNDRFLVLINGRKLNPISGTLLSVGNSIPLALAKRIEIVYGAASITYGSDAFSCVINIITEDETEIRDRKSNLRYQYGTFSSHDIAAGMKSYLTKNLKINVFGRSYSSNGFSPDASGNYALAAQYPNTQNNQIEQKIKNYFIFAEVFIKNFRFGFLRQHFNEGNSWGLNPKLYVYASDVVWKLHHDVYWANYGKRFLNGSAFQVDLSYNVHKQHEDTHFARFTALNNATTPIFRQYMTGQDKSFRALSTYNQSFFDKIDFVAGVQYDYANIIPAYANDHIYGQPLKFTGDVKKKISDTLQLNEQKLGIFSQIRVNFSKKIHLTAGARYEVSKIFDEAFIPRIALVIKPIQKFTMKAMYAYAFQSPSFFYLYEQFGNVSTIMLPNSKQNFLLNNQKIGTYDFEVSYQHNDIFVSADFFKSTATDLIERRTYTQAVFNPYAGKETSGLRNENIGEQNVIGLMLRTKYQINKKISVSGNYVYTKATFLYGADRAETWVPRISEHKFYAGADFHKIFGILNFTLNWQYFPSITPIAAARAGGKVEGHHFINASLSGMVTKNIRIFAVSQNMLGNKEHTGIFDGGIYSPVLPQAAFRGQIGAEIVY